MKKSINMYMTRLQWYDNGNIQLKKVFEENVSHTYLDKVFFKLGSIKENYFVCFIL